MKKYGSAVGKVETRDGTTVIAMGSCFLIDGTGLILTNAHVIKDASFKADDKFVREVRRRSPDNAPMKIFEQVLIY